MFCWCNNVMQSLSSTGKAGCGWKSIQYIHHVKTTNSSHYPAAKPNHTHSGFPVIPAIDFSDHKNAVCSLLLTQLCSGEVPSGLTASGSSSGEVKSEQPDDFLNDLLAQLDPPPGPSWDDLILFRTSPVEWELKVARNFEDHEIMPGKIIYTQQASQTTFVSTKAR